MEDNHAISEQPVAVNYEEEYNKLAVEFEKLRNTANQLYSRVKQLEPTWMLTRADFMFRIIASDNFTAEMQNKAIKELDAFLFPSQEDVPEMTNEQ